MKYASYEDFKNADMFGRGDSNEAYAQYFTGESFLNPLTDPEKTAVSGQCDVEPGCRNNWHIHHASAGGGQLCHLYGRRGLVPGRRQSACIAQRRNGNH